MIDQRERSLGAFMVILTCEDIGSVYEVASTVGGAM
jgi:hypothetical protein